MSRSLLPRAVRATASGKVTTAGRLSYTGGVLNGEGSRETLAPGAAESSEPSGEAPTADRAAAARASNGRAPDFFIVGHENSGTTALYKILRQHPQIFMPEPKEPRFFVARPSERGPVPRNPVRPWTLEAYLELFADAAPEQRAGEASPQYIRSKQAAQLIAEVQPDARIIASLREPTSFLSAYHMHCVRGLVETERDLRKAIALEGDRRRGEQLPREARAVDRLFYCEHVRYVEQLRRFETVFGRERMLVLIYEDFRRDNDATAREVLRFLDVDDTLALDVAKGDQTENLRRGGRGHKAVRRQRLHRAALALQLARRQAAQADRLSRTVDALTPRWLRSDAVENLARRMIFSAPPRDEQFMLELRRRFKPEVEALSEYLGRDLVALWGYEDIV